MLVHVIRVPRIEGGARVVVHDSGSDWVIFMLEELITQEGAQFLQAMMNATWVMILSRGELPKLDSLATASA